MQTMSAISSSSAEAADGLGVLLQGPRSQANSSGSFPVSCKEFSTVIQGNKTDFVLCSYDDYIFVLATQLGRMGTLLQARKEEVYGAQVTFNVSVLLGKHNEPMLEACARQLIERMSNMGSTRSLILSLGLKDHSKVTLKEIVETVCENKVW
ncbi:hypothetical protein L7F22_066762 [Adiantum nelumboides]|nr:hypothetical protein [Adiantum nelumboides]